MAIKSIERDDGCFSRALEDEPMFVLLARDPIAPWLVRAWSWIRRCQIYIGTRPETDFARCDEADRLAAQMRAWRPKANGRWRDSAEAGQICDCQLPPGRVKDFAAISVVCPIHGDGA